MDGDFHKATLESQKSMALYEPQVLQDLFYKGYAKYVVKHLVSLSRVLERMDSEGKEHKVADFIDLDLKALLSDFKQQTDILRGTSKTAAPTKKTAHSVFDDLLGGDSSESDQDDSNEVAN